ncbi:MAG: ATP-binding protein, partial [Planctomycetota bacterium]
MPPAERAEFLTTILRESERLGQRISDALECASLSGGKTQWTVGRVDLLRASEQACSRLDGLLQLKLVHFQVVSEDAVLSGDRERITQAIYQLLHNAWTWSPAGGTVEVTVLAVPGGFVVEVQDRGPGIPAHEQERIFDYFTQGGSVLVDKPAGIGIGLKIAAEVARTAAASSTAIGRAAGRCSDCCCGVKTARSIAATPRSRRRRHPLATASPLANDWLVPVLNRQTDVPPVPARVVVERTEQQATVVRRQRTQQRVGGG